MKTYYIFIIVILGAIFFKTNAQITENYSTVVSAGGGLSTNGKYSNFSVLGEPLVNLSLDGGNYQASIGFLYAVKTHTDIYELHIETPVLTVYPNPTTGLVTITSKNFEVGSIAVYNFLGSKILSTDLTQCCDLSHLPNGVYIIRITDKAGRRNSSVRVVKTN